MNFNIIFRAAVLIAGLYILSMALSNLDNYVGYVQGVFALFLIVLGVYPRAVSAILKINVGGDD